MQFWKEKRRQIVLYMILFAVIILLIVPLYVISYQMVRDQIMREMRSKAEVGIERLDMEAELYHTIRNQMQRDLRYIRMKNLSAFESSQQYSYLMDFSEYFMSMINMNTFMNTGYVFFKNNNTVVAKNRLFDDMEPTFHNFLDVEGLEWDAFREKIFDSSDSFSVSYVEDLKLEEAQAPSIMVSIAINPYINQPSEAVILGFYPIDELFAHMGIPDYREIFDYIAINDKVVYQTDRSASDDMIQVMGNNMKIQLSLELSNQYYLRHMRTFMYFVVLYLVLLILAILCLELFLNYWMNRPIKNMVSLVAKLTGDTAGDKGIEYVSDVVENINRENQQYHKNFLNFIFLKELDEDERAFIRKKCPEFAKPFLFVTFFGEGIKVRLVELCLEKFGIKSQRIFSPHDGECIVFMEYSQEVEIESLRDTLEVIVRELNGHHMNATAMIGIPCSDISEFYNAYQYIRHCYRFVDYTSVFTCVTENTEPHNDEDYSKLNEALYENLIQGKAFEANQTVYSLWYQTMTKGQLSENAIQKMFYKQMGILADVANKVKYCGELTEYDHKKKINELAFSIAEDVEAICRLIAEREIKDDTHLEILRWVDEHFRDPDFCMTVVEQQFGVSDKTIGRIVKASTGKTFLEYVEDHKLEFVKHLLAQSDIPTKTVAEQCGFVNYNTFYKFFKKHTGISPVKWRNIKKAESSY